MKFLRVFFVNIVLLFLIFCLSEFCLFKSTQKIIPNLKYHIQKMPYLNSVYGEKFREPAGLEYKTRPIVLLGCSFAFGQGLDYKDIFSVKLSEVAKRPVYNYAKKGKGLQSSLFIIQKGVIEPKNPEYIIYLYMDDHIRRLYSSCSIDDYVGYPIYSLNKDGYMELKYDYFPLYRQFYTFYYWNNVVFKKILKQNSSYNSKLLTAYFKSMNQAIKEKYPDTKFVVLAFTNQEFLKYDSLNLKDEEIIFINSNLLAGEDLTAEEYWQSKDDTHPTAEVWKILAPIVSEELNLI